MPATGLKIVVTGACLPWCSISSSFQNSLKMSGNRGCDFLEFWCWNLVPFLPDIEFWLLKSLWSHAFVIAVLCGFAFSSWNTRCLEGSIFCSKIFIYLSAFIVPSETCKLPIKYALMHPHTIRDAGFWEHSSLAQRTRRPWFPTRMSNLDSSDHRTLFKFETVHFKWALAHRTRRHFWAMFTYGFLFVW